MEEFDNILAALAKINPYWAAAVGVLLVLVRGGFIKLPFRVPLVSPPVPAEEVVADPNTPLKDRLKARVEAKYDELVEAGWDDDDVYAGLVVAVRGYDPEPKEEPDGY